MKNTGKYLLLFMVLPFVFISCGMNVSEQLKTEMMSLKKQCPQDQGDGVIMTDANFYEKDKILEYVCSIDEVTQIDANTLIAMKEAIIKALDNEVTAFEKLSIKSILKMDYRFRYIYTDTDGNKLCEIMLTKNDLP